MFPILIKPHQGCRNKPRTALFIGEETYHLGLSFDQSLNVSYEILSPISRFLLSEG